MGFLFHSGKFTFNSVHFRRVIFGIFCYREAEWDDLDASFYDFQQVTVELSVKTDEFLNIFVSFFFYVKHFDRLTECSAEKCRCPFGRTYESLSRRTRYSFIYCDCGGANGIHSACLRDDTFLCDVCKRISERNSIQNARDDNIDGNNQLIECKERKEFHSSDGRTKIDSVNTKRSGRVSQTFAIPAFKHR